MAKVADSKGEYFEPAPCRATSTAPPPPVDHDMLRCFASALLQCLNAEETSSLEQWVQAELQASAWRVGTMCSGTDSPILALMGCARALTSLLSSVEVRFEHVFSAELAPAKQAFLAAMFPSLGNIFGDLKPLHTGAPQPNMANGGQLAPVPFDLRILVAGFPCTDVSSRNSWASSDEHRSIIASAGRSTGSCWRGIMEYLAESKVNLLILENVYGLYKTGNLARCLQELKVAGFVARVFYLNPRKHFAWPQSRPRLWFVCFKADLLSAAHGINEEQTLQYMDSLMTRFCADHPLTSLDDALLPERHITVRTYLEECRASSSESGGSAKRQRKGPSMQVPKWVDDHRRALASRGKDWWALARPDQDIVRQLMPGMLRLTDRQWDLLLSKGFDLETNRQHSCIDLSQTADFSSMMHGVTPCITPGCMILSSQRRRLLCGEECLRLQGIVYSPELHNSLRSFPNELLVNLAGNAFETHCCVASLLVGFCTLAWLRSAEHRPEVDTVAQLPEAAPFELEFD